MKLSDEIMIDCPSRQLYAVLSDLEGHVTLLPGYIESRILERRGNTCLLQREAMIHGKRRRWKSEVQFEPERALHFTQIEGPLTGMRVLWSLEGLGNETRLRIIHELQAQPWWKRYWVEQIVAKPAIEKTARRVLEAIKQAVETSPQAS